MTPSTAVTADDPVPKTFVTSRKRTIVSEVVLTEEPLVRGAAAGLLVRAARPRVVCGGRQACTDSPTRGWCVGEGTPVPDGVR
ncbi:hypothetical protein GCM10010488_28060 [Oerskovia jenensis]